MKSTSQILFTLIFILSFFGCEKDTDPKNELILGKWKLISYDYSQDLGSITDKKNGTFPVDSYLDLKKDANAFLRIDDKIYNADYSISGKGENMKIFINVPSYIYDASTPYYITFDDDGFEVKELNSSRMVLHSEFFYPLSGDGTQTLVLEKE